PTESPFNRSLNESFATQSGAKRPFARSCLSSQIYVRALGTVRRDRSVSDRLPVPAKLSFVFIGSTIDSQMALDWLSMSVGQPNQASGETDRCAPALRQREV